jgi:hypothetical protein
MLGAKAVTFIILDPFAGSLPDPLTNWCRPGWHGGAPSPIQPQNYLHKNIFTRWRKNASPAKWTHFSPKLVPKLAWLG